MEHTRGKQMRVSEGGVSRENKANEQTSGATNTNTVIMVLVGHTPCGRWGWAPPEVTSPTAHIHMSAETRIYESRYPVKDTKKTSLKGKHPPAIGNIPNTAVL